MPVFRYRSIEEMPRPWRDPHSRGNLRLVARMLAFHRSLTKGAARRPGVERFRSMAEAVAGRHDVHRS